MSFEDKIFPLTRFLLNNSYSIAESSLHFIKYYSANQIITVAYNNLEHLFYIHVGKTEESLIELTPSAVNTVFKDESFKFQSSLTIDNLISFLDGSGSQLLLGNESVYKRLTDFTESATKEQIKKIMELQNMREADLAWNRKDYGYFIKCMNLIDQDKLPLSYLKKYRIATAKFER